VVNVAFARTFLGGQDPIGRFIELPNPSLVRPMVVGEVNNIRQIGREEPAEPEVFLPAAQGEYMPTSLVVRAAGDAGALPAAIHLAVREIDPSVPVSRIYRLEDELSKGAAPKRANAILLGLFGAVALLIAGMGLYGLMAFVVTQRTREIGVRVALGAARRDVLRLVVGQGAVLIAGGVVLGLVAALALARVLRGMLFGIAASDPVTFLVAPVLLAAIGLVATYVPGRRALRVDPMVALRAE
jgi:putative ABC transport system permease protein